jgi:hypothetical protein
MRAGREEGAGPRTTTAAREETPAAAGRGCPAFAVIPSRLLGQTIPAGGATMTEEEVRAITGVFGAEIGKATMPGVSAGNALRNLLVVLANRGTISTAEAARIAAASYQNFSPAFGERLPQWARARVVAVTKPVKVRPSASRRRYRP